MNSQKTLRVGMLGCGVVGSEVARLIVANQSDLASRSGAKLDLVKIGVRNLSRANVAKDLLTTDLESIVSDPSIDLVIEVIGGIEPAKTLILSALANGKSVVTANKALLAKHGSELFAAAVLIFITKHLLLAQSQSCARFANHLLAIMYFALWELLMEQQTLS